MRNCHVAARAMLATPFIPGTGVKLCCLLMPEVLSFSLAATEKLEEP